jgi:hypothetical protein
MPLLADRRRSVDDLLEDEARVARPLGCDT